MRRDFIECEPQRGGLFGIAAVSTVAIGVGLAVVAILHLRKPPAPPPDVIERPPEIRVVEKPAPPPQVIIKEVPVPAPAPPPPPPVQVLTANPVWDGVWRRKESPLPMVRLKLTGESVAGEIAPSWSAVVPFRDGSVVGYGVEFAADDGLFRAHFRMTLLGADRAKLESWVTDDDWLTSLARANKAARNPQQALVLRAILERNAKQMRKPIVVGTFTRTTG